MQDSPAYQAQLEGYVTQLAANLRDSPAIPADPRNSSEPWPDADDGALFPAKHCSFKDCTWHGSKYSELEAHLQAEHEQSFTHAESWVRRNNAVRHGKLTRMWLYNAAIANKERAGVPTVGSCVYRLSRMALSVTPQMHV